MISVACSGFPVPVSRYWGEFSAVEISDTEIGMPGSGTVRRWVRESPPGFRFSVLAPGSIGESGFKLSKETDAALGAIGELANTLKAIAVVFAAPEGFRHTKAGRSALKSFSARAGRRFAAEAVYDLPSWKPEQVAAALSGRGTVAYDPLNEAPAPPTDLAYLRLPGPAGYRSRYDEESLRLLAEQCRKALTSSKDVFVVFRNIDMQTNGAQLKKLLKD